MQKVYYDKNTGILCDRNRDDIIQKEDSPYIEVSDEDYEKTFISEAGKCWAVKNGKLEVIDDEVQQNMPIYKRMIINNKICEQKAILKNTDYIIQKLQESQILNENFEELKEKYANQLQQRKSAREKINELEAELSKI